MYICICIYVYMYICIYVYMYICICIDRNMKINSRTAIKHYEKVKFINVSISSGGVFGQSSLGFIDTLKDLKATRTVESTFLGK